MLKIHQFGDWMTRHTHFVDRMRVRVEMNTHHLFWSTTQTQLGCQLSHQTAWRVLTELELSFQLFNLQLDSTYSYTNEGQSTTFIASWLRWLIYFKNAKQKKVILMVIWTQDPNLFWDRPKNKILWRSSHKIVVRSHSSKDLHTFSSEDLLKILERKDLKKNL